MPVLFYADRVVRQREDMIRLVMEVAGKCGLNINKRNKVMYYCIIVGGGGASGEGRRNRSSQ